MSSEMLNLYAKNNLESSVLHWMDGIFIGWSGAPPKAGFIHLVMEGISEGSCL